MTANSAPGLWVKPPILLRAMISGLLIALVAANVWLLLLLKLGASQAALGEAMFLALYVWWTGGGGPPHRTQAARAEAFRRARLSRAQWFWSVVAAIFFAATVHASIVLLFRFVSYPLASFRRGYDFSFIPSLPLKWLVVVVSAISAGICEETGFRGYMQRPIEQRHGARVAILISSLLFTAVHLTKGWAMAGMVPIVFGAGVLLGLLAWSSGSLIPGMIGHVLMDIGLFSYWWTGIAGDFAQLPISATGIDRFFVITCATLLASFLILLLAISKLQKEGKERRH